MHRIALLAGFLLVSSVATARLASPDEENPLCGNYGNSACMCTLASCKQLPDGTWLCSFGCKFRTVIHAE
jgi:hypothetical protein